MILTYVFEEDCYGFDIEYEYEITSVEVDEAMRYILNDYSQDELIELLLDMDDKDDLIKYFEDEIKHYHEDDAKRAYFENKGYIPPELEYKGFLLGDFYE